MQSLLLTRFRIIFILSTVNCRIEPFDRDIAAEIRDSWEAYIPKIIRLAESEHDNHALQAARSTVGEYASDGTSIYF